MVNNNLFKKALLLVSLFFFSGLALAASDLDSGQSSATGASWVQQNLASIYSFFKGLSLFLGLGVMIHGAHSLTKVAGNQSKATYYGCFIVIIAGSLIFNLSQFLMTLTVTVLGSGYEFCSLAASSTQGCWDASSSELTGPLRDKVNQIAGGTSSLMQVINTVTMVFNLVGYITVFKGLFILKRIGELGTSHKDNLASFWLHCFFGSILCNIGWVIEGFQSAAKSFGLGA
ncbi:hypothetical protein [Pseudomonas savastanoi]|uniref:hypothetical protein n=1 Tax=Pseudomonas savastanoi TaxID=29438 RepID=UPI000EFE4ABF|nr:hypothetical protein [Pseudomonas savastanoi]